MLFKRKHKYKLEDLKKALNRYKPKPSIKGKNNPLYKNGNGEKYIRIRVNGKKVPMHHIIYCIHKNLDEIPSGFIIHHKDENKRNNKIENLEMVNAKEHGIWNMNWSVS